jgi:hypothetical protein
MAEIDESGQKSPVATESASGKRSDWMRVETICIIS